MAESFHTFSSAQEFGKGPHILDGLPELRGSDAECFGEGAILRQQRRWILDDGRICLSNNAAERAIRPIAVGRRNWTFAGSNAGGHRAAQLYTLIETAKLNRVDPQAWLADVLARLPDHPAQRLDDLLPWNWTQFRPQPIAA